jgi:hypothetical protein
MSVRKVVSCPSCGSKSEIEIPTGQFSLTDEESCVEAIARRYRSEPGYFVRKNVWLDYGIIDLVVFAPEGRLILIECKVSDSINDVAHALGQLLLYRDQLDFENYRDVTLVIHCLGWFSQKRFSFLENFCRKYDVQLVSPRPWFEGYNYERLVL